MKKISIALLGLALAHPAFGADEKVTFEKGFESHKRNMHGKTITPEETIATWNLYVSKPTNSSSGNEHPWSTAFKQQISNTSAWTATRSTDLVKLLQAKKTVEILVVAGWGNRGRLGSAHWVINGAAPLNTYHRHLLNVAELWITPTADSVRFSTDQRLFEIYYRELKTQN